MEASGLVEATIWEKYSWAVLKALSETISAGARDCAAAAHLCMATVTLSWQQLPCAAAHTLVAEAGA